MRRRLAAPALSLALDGAEGSPRAAVSPGPTPDGSLDVDVDALDTPSESELLDGFEWEGGPGGWTGRPGLGAGSKGTFTGGDGVWGWCLEAG